jgi:hypothetical protein
MDDTRIYRHSSLFFAFALLGLLHVTQAWSADDSDIQVQVQQRGRWIVVDVAMSVGATPLESWKVMTDYDNMASFVSNLESSRIIKRVGDTLTVMQKGKASRGPLTFSFENVRQIVLTPYREIHSHLISGDLEASDFTTQVVDHGTFTEIINHGEFIPNVWVPPLIGPGVIGAETRKQFGQLRAEILRRKTQTPIAGQP